MHEKNSQSSKEKGSRVVSSLTNRILSAELVQRALIKKGRAWSWSYEFRFGRRVDKSKTKRHVRQAQSEERDECSTFSRIDH